MGCGRRRRQAPEVAGSLSRGPADGPARAAKPRLDLVEVNSAGPDEGATRPVVMPGSALAPDAVSAVCSWRAPRFRFPGAALSWPSPSASQRTRQTWGYSRGGF